MGATLLISAYILMSYGMLGSDRLTYHAMILLGALGFVVFSYRRRAHQTVVVNVFWVLIALLAIVKIVTMA